MYDSKPWYASKTIWGAVSAILMNAALLAGIEVDMDDMQALTIALVNVGTIVGGLISVYGRKTAYKRIS